jgi:hypothetical protein
MAMLLHRSFITGIWYSNDLEGSSSITNYGYKSWDSSRLALLFFWFINILFKKIDIGLIFENL